MLQNVYLFYEHPQIIRFGRLLLGGQPMITDPISESNFGELTSLANLCCRDCALSSLPHPKGTLVQSWLRVIHQFQGFELSPPYPIYAEQQLVFFCFCCSKSGLLDIRKTLLCIFQHVCVFLLDSGNWTSL